MSAVSFGGNIYHSNQQIQNYIGTGNPFQIDVNLSNKSGSAYLQYVGFITGLFLVGMQPNINIKRIYLLLTNANSESTCQLPNLGYAKLKDRDRSEVLQMPRDKNLINGPIPIGMIDYSELHLCVELDPPTNLTGTANVVFIAEIAHVNITSSSEELSGEITDDTKIVVKDGFASFDSL